MHAAVNETALRIRSAGISGAREKSPKIQLKFACPARSSRFCRLPRPRLLREAGPGEALRAGR